MRLIISTGDVSDVDGFYALAAYARSGADVLFIMNYPAYVDSAAGTLQTVRELGLGFSYSADQVAPLHGEAFVDGADARRKLTNVAHSLCARTWAEKWPTGRFFFGIGGVNTVNPFAATDVGYGSIKNEPGVYTVLFSSSVPLSDLPSCRCGAVYDVGGEDADVPWGAYEDVYVDFNGSMAFLDDADWLARFRQLAPNIRGAFIQGGVRADGHAASTLPSIPGFLNRLSCSTMNQLYAPAGTAIFFDFLQQEVKANRGIPCYVVANNAVADLADDASSTGLALTRMRAFLEANELVPPSGAPSFLWDAAVRYYTNPAFRAPRKAFDLYTAVALVAAMAKEPPLPATPQVLFYDTTYGIALLAAPGTSAAEAVALHVRGLRAKEAETMRAAAATAAAPILLATVGEFSKEAAFFEAYGGGVGAPALRALAVLEVTFEGTNGEGPLTVTA